MNDLTRSAAIHLYKKGRVIEARQVLLECVRKDPQDVASWMWLVETIADTDERIAALRLCLKANPENPEVKQALALLAAKKNQPAPGYIEAPQQTEMQQVQEPGSVNLEPDVTLPGGWIKEIAEEVPRDSDVRNEEIGTGNAPDIISSISPLPESSQEKETALSPAEILRADLATLPANATHGARQQTSAAQQPLEHPKKKQSIFVFLLKVIAILTMLAILFALVFVVWWVGTGHTTSDLVESLVPGAVYPVEVIPTAEPTAAPTQKLTFPPTYTPEPTLAATPTPSLTTNPALAMVIQDGLRSADQAPPAAVSSLNMLAYQAGNNVLKVISLVTLEEIHTADVPARLLGLAFSPDGKRLAGVDEKGLLTIWDTENWQAAGSVQLTTSTGAILLEQIAFTPDGYGLLAGYCAALDGTCSGASSVVMLNMPDGGQRYALAGVNRFASGSGDLMAVWQAGKPQNLLKLVSQFSGGTIRYLQLPAAAQQETLSMAAISPGSSQVSAATGQGSAAVWDGLTGRLLAAWQSGIKNPGQVIFVPGTSQVLIGNSQSVGQVWDFSSQQMISNFNLNAEHGTFFLDSDGALRCVRAVSPSVEVWDVVGLEPLEIFTWEAEKAVSAIAVLQTSQFVVFSDSGAMSIWNSEYTR